jgi:hypothetical protein
LASTKREELLVAPLHLHEAVFEMDGLREGARRNTEFGPIRVDTFDNSDGWQFEITTPGPGLNRRQVIKYLEMVHVELIDSEGQPHRPRSQTSGGGGGGTGVGGPGRAPGIDELTRIVTFAALPEGVVAESLRVRIRETGEARRVPFHLSDVELD